MDFVPPKRVFKQTPQDARERHETGTYNLPGFLFPGRTKNGGMTMYFQGHPLPRKGFVYAEAVMAVAKVKRFTLSLFQPFADIKKGLIGFLESYLFNYNRFCDILFADCRYIPFFHYEYYCEFSKSVWNFSFLFLRKLGISFNVAYKTGQVLATIFENDDAYKFPLEDILSESSKEKLLNPRKEIPRLIQIYKERSRFFEPETGQGAGDKIVKMAKLISLLMVVPKIKKAFIFALENVNFKWFQYDELDYYWSLNRADYDCGGRTLKDRKEEQIKLMIEYAEKMNPGRKIEREDIDEKTTKINVI